MSTEKEPTDEKIKELEKKVKKLEEKLETQRQPESMGLGEVFSGIGGFIKLLDRMVRSGIPEVKHTAEIKDIAGIKDLRAIYGYSVKIGLGGKPVIETFGNVRPSEAGSIIEEKREPLVDVFEEKDNLTIMAELPGVAEKDIKLEVKPDKLVISTDTLTRKYYKEVALPSSVKIESVKKTYNNGILEVKLEKIVEE